MLREVTKTYRLYGSRAEQALDVMGLTPLLFWRRQTFSDHPALSGVTLSIARGERVAIVGRNGAGKTTLLKLITGNFQPTSGSIHVEGRVQALMNLGIGFHPEFSGYDNVKSSLAYGGLTGDELARTIQDVVDFSELGEYLHQPFKTYSAGMQARLMFAASTAIRPDILIVDEILSAGDAYFSAKSSHRMQKLAGGGCTLLLVSHSMPQVLQFCDRAIWIEAGRVVMDDDAIAVVKAYEEYSHRLEAAAAGAAGSSVLANTDLRNRLLAEVFKVGNAAPAGGVSSLASAGGVSRWSGEPGMLIDAVRVVNVGDGSVTGLLKNGADVNIEIEVVAQEAGTFPCTFVVILFTSDGRVLSRHTSAETSLVCRAGDRHSVALRFEPLLLGNGTYFVSAAVYKTLSLSNLPSSKAYDLLSRSFEFKVVAEYADDPSLFHHPSAWSLDGESA